MGKFTNNNFIDVLKDKTEGFQQEPPKFIWDNIETHLQDNPILVRNKKFISLVKMGVVSIIIVLLFLGFFFNPFFNFFDRSSNLTAHQIKSNEQPNFLFKQHKLQTTTIEKENITSIGINNRASERVFVENSTTDNDSKINNPNLHNESINLNNDSKINEVKSVVNTTVDVENDKNSSAKQDVPANSKRKQYILNTNSFNGIKSVVFVNSLGKEALKIKAPENIQSFWNLDVSSLPSGTYQIKVESASKIINYKKVTFNE